MNNTQKTTLAIIGGTGLNTMDGVKTIDAHRIETPYGFPSSEVFELEVESGEPKSRFYFLPRHGKPHSVAPHLINYRANIAALHQLGVEKVIAINAVGSIDPALKPQDIVVPHQLIDYTHGREASFYDGVVNPLDHYDFSDPFDHELRDSILRVIRDHKINATGEGVYGVTQGPRLETAAEITRMSRDGATLVGMTLMPEAVLAREVALAYATICLVVNPAAGVSNSIITMDEIKQAIEEGMGRVQQLILTLMTQLSRSIDV